MAPSAVYQPAYTSQPPVTKGAGETTQQAASATEAAVRSWSDASSAPKTAADWLSRAEEVATILAIDIVARERANSTPYREVELLKQSGLVTFLGPAEFGGAGGDWATAYRLIRIVAAVDGSIGQLYAYHLIWYWHARVLLEDAEYLALAEQATRGRWVFGGAVNPRDSDLTVTDHGEEISFSGVKSFSTGGVISDVTVLEGVLEGTDQHIFSFVPTKQPGIIFRNDWDALGQRLTESGSVEIRDVRVPWSGAAGWDAKTKSYTAIPYHTLSLPLIQLAFTSFYFGIAKGALETARDYTVKTTRPWPADQGGRGEARGVDEWYVQEGYGTLYAHLRAAEALLDNVTAAASELAHSDRHGVTFEQRNRLSAEVATAKIAVTDHALHSTQKIFELTGARATSNKVDLARFWRNVRTHSLHDPLPYRKTLVGEYFLEGKLPSPSWYT